MAVHVFNNRLINQIIAERTQGKEFVNAVFILQRKNEVFPCIDEI